MGFPEAYDICKRENLGCDLFVGGIEFDLKPYRGENPAVMLVGQDPTVTGRTICAALDLDNPSGPLYKYIVSDILKPAGLGLRDTYATDLVKCRFPDNQTPKMIAVQKGCEIVQVLDPFFENCRNWFRQELDEIRPRVIVSLGQPVHQMLRKEFGWDVPERMKDAFGGSYLVEAIGGKISYVPCIHMNSRGHRHYRAMWPDFKETLRISAGSAGRV